MRKLKKMLLFFFLVTALSSCRRQKDLLEAKNNYVASDSISFNGLLNKLSFEYLLNKGEKIYFSPLSIIKPFMLNKLVIYDGDSKIFITNINMEVEKCINLKNKDYYFTGSINDLTSINDDIYLLDNSFVLKKLNIIDESLTKIKIDPAILKDNFIYSFQTISTYNRKLLLTPGIPVYLTKDNICLGILINTDGEEENEFSIKKTEGDISLWSLSGDFVYFSQFNSDLLFCFKVSRKVFRFNPEGIFMAVYELPIDKRYYFEPEKEKTSTNRGGITVTGNKVTFTPMNSNGLQVDNAGNIYFLLFQGQFNKQKLVRLNSSFDIIGSKIINEINNCCYKFLITKNTIIILNDDKAYLYN
jgi:hypothetical protein